MIMKRLRVEEQHILALVAADLHLHIHAPAGRALRSASLGTVGKARVMVPAALLANRNTVEIDIS